MRQHQDAFREIRGAVLFCELCTIQERNMTRFIAELMTTQMCRQDKCQQQFANWSEEDFREMTDDVDMQSILILNVDSERNMSISVKKYKIGRFRKKSDPNVIAKMTQNFRSGEKFMKSKFDVSHVMSV